MKNFSIVLLIILCIFNIGCTEQQSNTSQRTDVQFSQTIEDKKVQILKSTPKPVENNKSLENKVKVENTVEPTIEKSEFSETIIEESPKIVVEESSEIITEEELENIETVIDLEEQNYSETENKEIEQNVVAEEEEEEENNDSGLTKESGVNSYDGRTETYYSSETLYHQDTDEWNVDDEGFYRTDEGYYVVAASDMPQGTTFEGSKGTCVVLDSGCDENTTDYYTNW